MAIRLLVDEWCHNCPEFEADAYKNTYVGNFDSFDGTLSRYTDTTVKCIHKDRCANMIDYLRKCEKNTEED